MEKTNKIKKILVFVYYGYYGSNNDYLYLNQAKALNKETNFINLKKLEYYDQAKISFSFVDYRWRCIPMPYRHKKVDQIEIQTEAYAPCHYVNQCNRKFERIFELTKNREGLKEIKKLKKEDYEEAYDYACEEAKKIQKKDIKKLENKVKEKIKRILKKMGQLE